MRVLRRALREGRRDLAARDALPTAQNSLAILLRHVRENESQFRFLVREQRGGIAEIRRAIDTELRLFSKELAIDLARMPDLARWQSDDLELAAELIVIIMLTAVADLLDLPLASELVRSAPAGRGTGRPWAELPGAALAAARLGVDAGVLD